jgi:hypothetical protein
MKFQYDDGGRRASGYVGETGDCGCRAVAIATGYPYDEIYKAINQEAHCERFGKRKRGVSSARTGVYGQTMKRLMARLGWIWTPAMGIGTGCTVHLRDGELPMGRLVVSVSRHYVCVIDGVIHDTYDPSRGGNRCVYGYWQRKSK